MAAADPAVAARGWLAGWGLALSAAVGSAVEALIHALTGGRWREAGKPWLLAAASAAPVLCLLGGVLLLAQDLLFPWTGAPEGTGGSVEALYLDATSFTLRAVVILAIWATLGLLARAPRRRGSCSTG